MTREDILNILLNYVAMHGIPSDDTVLYSEKNHGPNVNYTFLQLKQLIS